MHGLAMKSSHCGAQQPEKGVRNGRKCLNHCEWKWYSDLNTCMSAEMLSTSPQHFQMQRYIVTCIYRHAHVFYTLRFVSSLTQVCSRYHFLWRWLKTRKISPTGVKNHCKPNHFYLKVTARSKKCAISSK